MVSGMLRRWRQDWYSHVRSLDPVLEMPQDLKSMSRFLEILLKNIDESFVYSVRSSGMFIGWNDDIFSLWQPYVHPSSFGYRL